MWVFEKIERLVDVDIGLIRSDLTKRKLPKSVVYRRKEKLSWKLILKKTWHAIHQLVALYIL